MKTQSYINFLWNSSNLHGIHSPFVFGFISKCLFAKMPRLTRSEHRALKTGISYATTELLHRIITCTKASKLFILEDGTTITDMLRNLGQTNNIQLWFFSPLAPIPGGADLVYISGKDKNTVLPLLEQAIDNIHNYDKPCIIADIHATPDMEKAWKAIKKDPRVTVSIDLYHMGLVFFRQGQAKQHFVIRTATSGLLNAFLGIKNLWGLLG